MLDQILQYVDPNVVMCLYPKVAKNGVTYKTARFSEEEIGSMKAKVKNANVTCVTQTEYFYKDLIKIVVLKDKKETIYFVKRENSHVHTDGSGLLVISRLMTIDESQYPKLSCHDNVCTKNMEIYRLGNIDIVFVTCNGEKGVFLNVSNVKKTDSALFDTCINAIMPS